MAELRHNLTQGELCVFCLDDGWLELHEKGLAPCGFCEVGHRLHQKHGGPWNYKLHEIASTLLNEYEDQLTVEERKAWHKIQESQRAAHDRGKQLNLGFGPRPDTMGSDDDGQARTSRNDRDED